jgi:PAS domain S-box-containing protein
VEDLNSKLKESIEDFLFKKNENNPMIIIVSLEQEDFFQIVEVNSEIEYQLGYNRNELLKFSATKLMPQYVARHHHQLVHDFFQTMKTSIIGRRRLKFFKHKEGYIVPCIILSHIIPSIRDGLKCISIFHVDKGISMLTDNKIDKTKQKVRVSV